MACAASTEKKLITYKERAGSGDPCGTFAYHGCDDVDDDVTARTIDPLMT